MSTPVLLQKSGARNIDECSPADVSAAAAPVSSTYQGVMTPADYNYLYSLSTFVWLGAWSSTRAYVVNDAVSYNNSSYICTSNRSPNVSPPPSDTGHWDVLAVGSTGSGDVVGPSSSVDGAPVLFDGTTGKLIKNGTGQDLLDLININSDRLLIDNSGDITSVDWNNRQLVDQNSNIAVNWHDRVLSDDGSHQAVNWGQHQLGNAGTIILDWSSYQINDSSQVLSINWQNRQLIDNINFTSVDWLNRQLEAAVPLTHAAWDINTNYSNGDPVTYSSQNYVNSSGREFTGGWSGSNSYAQGDLADYNPGSGSQVYLCTDTNVTGDPPDVDTAHWANVIDGSPLNDPTGWSQSSNFSNVITAYWNNCSLNDFVGNQSLDWGNRLLFDASDSYSIDYGNYTLQKTGVTLVDWANGLEYDLDGNQSVDWFNHLLSGNFIIPGSTFNVADNFNDSSYVNYNSNNYAVNGGVQRINQGNWDYPTVYNNYDMIYFPDTGFYYLCNSDETTNTFPDTPTAPAWDGIDNRYDPYSVVTYNLQYYVNIQTRYYSGTWDVSTQYDIGSVVFNPDNSDYYYSSGQPIGTPPQDDPTNWHLIGSEFDPTVDTVGWALTTVDSSKWYNIATGTPPDDPYTFYQHDNYTEVSTVDWANCELIDVQDEVSVNWQSRQLTDSTGSGVSVDWENRELSNSSQITVDWDNQQLINANAQPTVDWRYSRLYDDGYNPSVISVDWVSRYLYDSDGLNSVNWNSRQLYKYEDQQLVLDWESLQLTDSAGQFSVDWGSRWLYDSTGQFSVYWDNRFLLDGSGTGSVDWGDRQLLNSVPEPLLDWSCQSANPSSANYWFDPDNNNRLTGDGSGLTGVSKAKANCVDTTSNVDDTATDLYVYTIPANTFLANGDKIIGEFGGQFYGDDSTLMAIRVYCGNELVFDLTSYAPATTQGWYLRVIITAVGGGGSEQCYGLFGSGGYTIPIKSNIGNNWTTDNDFKIVGLGSASNQVELDVGSISFQNGA